MTARALTELLAEAGEHHARRPAAIANGASLSYAELLDQVRRVADALIHSGVEAEEPVGLAIPKSFDAIVAAYGIMFAGAAYVPIDPFVPPERAIRIAQNVDMRFIVTSTDRIDGLVGGIAASVGPQHAFVPSDIPGTLPPNVQVTAWRNHQPADPVPVVAGGNLAYILHTSGSTGLPKGVAITHGNALAFVDMAAEYFGVQPEDRLSSQAPLHFDLSVFDLYVACRRGAAIVLVPEYYSAFPRKMIETIREQRISVWNSVVSALTLMMERGNPAPGDFDRLRTVIFSGEAMPSKYMRRLLQEMPRARFYNVYGQTEANSSMVYPIDDLPDDDSWRMPIGKPFPGFDVFALNDKGSPIGSSGEEGELYIRAGTVARGYWNNPEITAEKFVADPRTENDATVVYRTGDMVSRDDDGNFLFTGRKDNMIKSRGYRVELGDIDQTLLAFEDVEAAAAVAIPDPVLGNRIACFASAAQDRTLKADALLKFCQSRLPTYMVPEHAEILESLPRTSTGKIDRQALAKIAEDLSL